MGCQEKDSLLVKYQRAVHVYSNSVLALREATRFIPAIEFSVLWKVTQAARVSCESAQRILHEHVAEHGC
jgi:hypothetical protein